MIDKVKAGLVSRIKVGLWWYTLEIADEVRGRATPKETSDGGVDHYTRRILVSRQSADSIEANDTVLHETIHCLLYQAGHNVPEAAIEALSHGLGETFPGLLALMQQEPSSGALIFKDKDGVVLPPPGPLGGRS